MTMNKQNNEHNPVPNFYRASAQDFKKIPGNPIAYWVSDRVRKIFAEGKPLGEIAEVRKGMVTAQNNVYVRNWYELNIKNNGLDRYFSREEAKESQKKWFSYLKGGGYRKFYGNKLEVLNWENDGKQLQTKMHPTENRVWATNFNLEYIFKPNINWGAVTSSEFSARISLGGELFDAGGSACFPMTKDSEIILGFLNSKVSNALLNSLNPTLNFQAGNIGNLPVEWTNVKGIAQQLINLSRTDWDSYEISWDFQNLPLLEESYRRSTFAATYSALREHWKDITLEMQRLEEENNRLFIEAYGLEEELASEVPLQEITLTCNPYYRYGKAAAVQTGFPEDGDLEKRLRNDTVREFLSYAVGCMMGRYSLDHPGLILANAGEGLGAYWQCVGIGENEARFVPDKDGIIPLLDDEWLADDIVARTREFVSAAFGAEHLQENMRFIEEALGKDLRKYFLTDFYKEHLQTYKKHPIYWLVQSPRKGFSCLIYLHRYTRDTMNVVLNRYLRDYQNKLHHHINHLRHTETSAATPREKAAAIKETERLQKVLHECEEWERKTILPLAQARVDLDLDDGVKVNYQKLGKALAPIAGMGKEE